MLAVGISPEDLRRTYDEVVVAAVVQNDYGMPYENNLPIAICRKPRTSLKALWPRTKIYG